MQVSFVNFFRFNQFYLQNDGGWCAGISVALIAHLTANVEGNGGQIRPVNAFVEARDFISLLRFSYNKITGQVTPGFGQLRSAVGVMQRPFDGPAFLSEGRPRGTYEYDFNAPGIAFLNLNVIDRSDTNFGDHFDSRFSWGGDTNHAGVAVWASNRDLFVFDPNGGGVLMSNVGNDALPVLIDVGLHALYNRFDRMRGARVAKVVNAQRLDERDLPFDRI